MHKANPDKLQSSSACWAGYLSVYQLAKTGELILVGIEYPSFNSPMESDIANETPEKFSVGYSCKNSTSGVYYIDFRLNDHDIVAGFKKHSEKVDVNKVALKVLNHL